MIVYKITNRINGKIYIGQTIGTLADRWARHCAPSSGCTALHNAICKYGKENFTVEQIDVACTRDELNQKGKYWIRYYDSFAPNGYNLSEGGDGCLGFKHSEETRRALSTMRIGKKGTPHSQEWKSAASARQQGGKHPHKGHPLSIEQKRLLSALHTGKPNPAKYKPVYCIDTGAMFDSVQAAAAYVGKSDTAIINAIKRGHRCCGMRWAYGNGKTVEHCSARVP